MRHCETRCDICGKVIDKPWPDITAQIYQVNTFLFEGGEFCSEECLNKWCDGLTLRLKEKQGKKETQRRMKFAKAKWG